MNLFEVVDGFETLTGYLTYLYDGIGNVINIVGFETDGGSSGTGTLTYTCK